MEERRICGLREFAFMLLEFKFAAGVVAAAGFDVVLLLNEIVELLDSRMAEFIVVERRIAGCDVYLI